MIDDIDDAAMFAVMEEMVVGADESDVSAISRPSRTGFAFPELHAGFIGYISYKDVPMSLADRTSAACAASCMPA